MPLRNGRGFRGMLLSLSTSIGRGGGEAPSACATSSKAQRGATPGRPALNGDRRLSGLAGGDRRAAAPARPGGRAARHLADRAASDRRPGRDRVPDGIQHSEFPAEFLHPARISKAGDAAGGGAGRTCGLIAADFCGDLNAVNADVNQIDQIRRENASRLIPIASGRPFAPQGRGGVLQGRGGCDH